MGPGIPAPDLDRIFPVAAEKGAPPSRQGNGLGLAICQSIAEIHRGSMRVENRLERSGLRVVVQLPSIAE
jgi:K+-sensing histidine kinase KdpD